MIIEEMDTSNQSSNGKFCFIWDLKSDEFIHLLFIFKDDPTIKRVNRWDKQSKIDADNEQEYAVSSPSSNSSPSLNKQGML